MQSTIGGLDVIDLDEVPDDFLAGEVEDAHYYRATRLSIPGFEFGYLDVKADGASLAIVPYFTTRFSIGTMLENGWQKRLVGGIGVRIACIGHPAASIGRVQGALSEPVIDAVTKALHKKTPIVCFKGFGPMLPAKGFVRVDGLPSAFVNFDEAAWQKIRSSRNIRRKLKAAASLRYEEHQGIPREYIDTIYDLYQNTHARATTTFGKLTKEYFQTTSADSIYSLIFIESRLVGFSQILRKRESAVASFMGMDYEVNESVGLYFAIVIRIMDIAPAWGLKVIEMGETSYSFKKRIGCELQNTWIYYRHRNPMANALLRRLAWLLEPSPAELE